MPDIFLNPQKIRYNDNQLYLKYSGGETSAFSLDTGVELSIYTDPTDNVLKAKIALNPNNTGFDDSVTYSRVLFKGEDTDSDIHGGFIKVTGSFSDKIRLAETNGGNNTDIHIAMKDVFHVSIIGVDDIRAKTQAPNYNQTYLMEEQKIHLKLEENEEEEKVYLNIYYKKRI
jgi:hypothetical protein